MIFAGNWKLNLSPKKSYAFIQELLTKLSKEQQKNCFFFPQNLSLPASIEAASGSELQLGSQNIYFERTGAFTGENSLEALEDLGASLCLIGHSERRSLFAETDSILNKKMLACKGTKIRPMLCIGESLEQRKNAETNQTLKKQLDCALEGVLEEQAFHIAYEPIWAIGTGEVASPEMAEDAHQFIRSYLAQRYSKEKSQNTAILYGGSVKPENASELAQKDNIDGFLIGGASLKVDSFIEIISNSL